MSPGEPVERVAAPDAEIGAVTPPARLAAVARLDDAVDRAFDLLRGHEPSDRIIYALTELADFSLLWHLLAWSRALADEDATADAVRVSVCLGVESVVVNGLLKTAFRRERPVVQTERPHRLRVPLTTSFPSGHASSAVLSAMLLSQRGRAPLWWALAVTVAASRVHVRIHHASDVLGGAAVGFALGLAAKRIWPAHRATRGMPGQRGKLAPA